MSKSSLTVESEEEQFDLLRAIARGESIANAGNRRVGYNPMLKHPLPLSDHRHLHEAVLRKVMSCRLELQAFGAVAKGDAWTLEEVYMRGAPIDGRDKNGFTPLHLAIQMNSLECVLVLLHMKADVNALSLSGYTPLFLAEANGNQGIIGLIREHGGEKYIQESNHRPKTILDVDLNKNTSINKVNESVGLPNYSFQY